MAIAAQPSPPALWKGIAAKVGTFGPMARKGSVALLDQAIISGTRFFTTILVGRAAGPAELGFYSLAVAALILTIVVQESLVTTPYTMFAQRRRADEGAEYIGSVLVHHLMLGVAAMVVLAASAVLVWLGGFGSPQLATILWVLAAIIPFVLLREFARRVAFAHLNMGTVLTIDAVTAGMQIIVLLLLAWRGALSAVSAYVTIGVACSASGITWLVVSRKTLVIRLRHVGAEWRRSWAFGRWVCAGQVGGVVHGYLMYWILGLLVGAGGTGLYAAAESIILFSNPLILGLGSLIDPESANSLASGGRTQLLTMVKRSIAFVGTLMGVFVLLVFALGDVAMTLLYGDKFGGQGLVIAVLGMGALLSACSIPLSSGLKALERPDVNFKARVVSIVVTFIIALPLVSQWGILGGAVSLLAGHIVNVLMKAIVFARLISPGPMHQPSA